MVSVIIINYNTFTLTCQCIESIIRFTTGDYEIILVDNNSTECDAVLFKQRFPVITLIKSETNNGFAKGNNLGIQHATGDIILLLNSDTYLLEDSITKGAVMLQNNKTVGVLGVRMTYPDGAVQRTARRFRSISWELLDLFKFIPFMLPYEKRAPLMLGKYFNGNTNMYCDWLNGAFFMFPRAVLQQLPGNKLDERFFMYGEDQLWCYQIGQLGLRCFFYSGTTIVHIEKGSTNREKQLLLIKKTMGNELEIMRERLGMGVKYQLLRAIYLGKAYGQYYIKTAVYKLSGKLIK